MTKVNHELEILTTVFQGFLRQLGPPNALVITDDNVEALASGVLDLLDYHGWSLTYDQVKTDANILAVTKEVRKRMGSVQMSTPARPPELLGGPSDG